MSNQFEFKKFIGIGAFVLTAVSDNYSEANIYIGDSSLYIPPEDAAALLEIAKAATEAYHVLTAKEDK